MMTLQTILSFFGASVVLAVAPGPDNLFVLTQAAAFGRRAGWLVTLGLCTGLLFHTTAVALGVAALFQASVLAFALLKVCGAGYLLWLAWGAWRAPAASLGGGAGALGSGALYRRGIVMNATNPKVSLFFLAFLPQFADPARGPVWLQVILLGAVFAVATILVFGSVAVVAGALGDWLSRHARAQVLMNRLAALIFAALAAHLILTRH
jgi:threonine/homoserine/homoserine lactone efflux protein